MNKDKVASIESEMSSLGVRHIYDKLIKDGQSPNMAAMLAAMQPPGVWNTDSNFNRRENDRMKALDDNQMDDIVSIAKRAGITTHGKSYNGQLGKYDDPLAWVSSTNDVKKSAMKKGLDVDGMVKVKGYRGPRKKTRLASDIVDRLEGNARRKDRKLDESCKKSDNVRTQLREKLTIKHSQKPKE